MMTRNGRRVGSGSILSLGLCATLLALACTHEPMAPASGNPGGLSGVPGTTGRACSPDSVYFANDIYPLISSTCAMSGCHDARTRADGVDLSNYAGILREVSPGRPTNSELYKEIVKTGSERMPPPPMPAWTAAQVALLNKWITQGAKNNACDRCDTLDFKYSTALKDIVTNKCQGCHNPSNKSGNIDLSTYAGLKAVTTNGRLYGSVTWSTGYSKMPPALKLPDCEIRQIKKWIDAGAPNN
jgi:hypothetical protein